MGRTGRYLLTMSLVLVMALGVSGAVSAGDVIGIAPGSGSGLEADVDPIIVVAPGADMIRFTMYVGALADIEEAEQYYSGPGSTRVFSYRVDLDDALAAGGYEMNHLGTRIGTVTHDTDDESWTLVLTREFVDHLAATRDWSYGDPTTWLFTPGDNNTYWWGELTEANWDTHRHLNLYPCTAYWPLEQDQDEPDTAFDVAAGHDGSIRAAEFTTEAAPVPHSDSALAFAGEGEVLARGLPHADSLTVILWARFAELNSSDPGLIQGSPDGLAFSEEAEDKSVGIWVHEDGQIWGRLVQADGEIRNFDRVKTLAADTWYQIAVAADADLGVGRLFVDGIEVASVDYDGTLQDWSDFGIGRQADQSWDGVIDDVRVFRRALSAAEISDMLPHTLALDVVGGGVIEADGTVVDTPYTFKFARAAEVELTAVADSDWEFVKWVVGGLTVTSPTITVEVDGAREAVAYFASDYTLTVTAAGQGIVLVDGTEVTLPYVESFGEETEVELEAVAASGWQFARWVVGEEEFDESAITIDVDGAVEARAQFTQVTVGEATLRITPRTLNLRAQGRWVTAHISPPAGYSVSDIDVGTIRLWNAAQDEYVEADWAGGEGGRLGVKFSWSAVAALLEPGNAVSVLVTFEVNGRLYLAEDEIKVIRPGGGPPWRR